MQSAGILLGAHVCAQTFEAARLSSGMETDTALEKFERQKQILIQNHTAEES